VSQQLGIPGANYDSDSSGFTPMVIAGYRGLGDSNFIPIIIVNNVFQYVGNVTYIRGGHTFKFGGDVRRRQTDPFQSPQSRGQFTFNGNFTNDPTGATTGSGNAIASLLLGFPSNTLRAKYLVSPGFRNTEFAGYAQDDWRVTRWLTLNLGLRYDLYTPQHEVADRISNLDLQAGKIIIAGQNGVSHSAGMPYDSNNFAPRFGFAATPTPKTVIRGGFGVNYYPVSFGSGAALRNPPFVHLYTIDLTPITPQNRISDGFPIPLAIDPLNPSGNLTTVARDIVNPYIMQYNVTIQREILAGLVFNVGYVGALARKQNVAPNLNLALPGEGAIQPRRIYYSKFPNVQSIAQLSSWGNSNYHSLQLGVEHRFKSGLNLSSNYTWSHLIDDFPNGSGKVGAGPFPQLVNNYKLERGNSDIDLRHRFVLMVNYEVPFGRDFKGAAGMLAKGWQVNAIGVLATGTTFTVQNGAARSNTGGNDRPNYLRNANLPGDQRSLNRWVDTSAFVAQPLNEIGNEPRNPVYGPGRETLDFSLFKDFRLTERLKLQFRAEAFNITNTPNFEVPGNLLGTAAFGVISGTANTLPRNLQFALKLLF
jgi:outer membrane receptor protein involved in Fe transport